MSPRQNTQLFLHHADREWGVLRNGHGNFAGEAANVVRCHGVIDDAMPFQPFGGHRAASE